MEASTVVKSVTGVHTKVCTYGQGSNYMPFRILLRGHKKDCYILSFYLQELEKLTLKAPNKNRSRRYFNFLLLSFEENKA